MVEKVLFFDFVGILVVSGLWIRLYRALCRRLKEREGDLPPVKKNGVDHFFSMLRLMLLSEDRQLKDPKITLLCLAIKILTVILLILFLGLVFGPFCLGGDETPN